jgi:CDP-diacylglycerol--glycerol-3-phosphate 3-phosphatidyltransferase
MTTANKITIIRILLIPFFAVLLIYHGRTGHDLYRLLALLTFLLAAVSDGIDGYIARRYNQRSELGAILDPLADKLLLVVGLVLLTIDNRPHLEPIPLWLTAAVFSRDFILFIGMMILHYTFGQVKVRPHWTGKIATVLQMIVIVWCLLEWEKRGLTGWSVAAASFTGISSVFYLVDGIRQLSRSPTSAASPQQQEK